MTGSGDKETGAGLSNHRFSEGEASCGMSSETTPTAWQAGIIADASTKLGRELTDRERRFITARGGFLALEAIADVVRAEPKEHVERYLSSE
jgi:hypothetical protein